MIIVASAFVFLSLILFAIAYGCAAIFHLRGAPRWGVALALTGAVILSCFSVGISYVALAIFSHISYVAFVIFSLIVFAIAYGCAAIFRLRGAPRWGVALAVAGAVFLYTTHEHHFPKLPDFVPKFDTLALASLSYVDECPVWASYCIYQGQYERRAPAEEVAREIENKLRANPACDSVSVKPDEWQRAKCWTITAHVPRQPRMPAGGGCEFRVFVDDPRVGLLIFRARPWL